MIVEGTSVVDQEYVPGTVFSQAAATVNSSQDELALITKHHHNFIWKLSLSPWVQNRDATQHPLTASSFFSCSNIWQLKSGCLSFHFSLSDNSKKVIHSHRENAFESHFSSVKIWFSPNCDLVFFSFQLLLHLMKFLFLFQWLFGVFLCWHQGWLCWFHLSVGAFAKQCVVFVLKQLTRLKERLDL